MNKTLRLASLRDLVCTHNAIYIITTILTTSNMRNTTLDQLITQRVLSRQQTLMERTYPSRPALGKHKKGHRTPRKHTDPVSYTFSYDELNKSTFCDESSIGNSALRKYRDIFPIIGPSPPPSTFRKIWGTWIDETHQINNNNKSDCHVVISVKNMGKNTFLHFLLEPEGVKILPY